MKSSRIKPPTVLPAYDSFFPPYCSVIQVNTIFPYSIPSKISACRCVFFMKPFGAPAICRQPSFAVSYIVQFAVVSRRLYQSLLVCVFFSQHVHAVSGDLQRNLISFLHLESLRSHDWYFLSPLVSSVQIFGLRFVASLFLSQPGRVHGLSRAPAVFSLRPSLFSPYL